MHFHGVYSFRGGGSAVTVRPEPGGLMSFFNALLPGRLTFPRGPDFMFLLSRSSELFIATTIFFFFFFGNDIVVGVLKAESA